MRPAFHKPGVIPLLALVVFSLLALVPSLPSIYGGKFADFSYYYVSGARRTSIVLTLASRLLAERITELTNAQMHPFSGMASWISNPTVPHPPAVGKP